MIDKLQLTLYEFFGYLLPGSVAVFALSLAYWALCIPRVPVPIYRLHLGIAGWCILAVLSYLLGHTLQGIGNAVFRRTDVTIYGKTGFVPAAIAGRARDLIASQVGIKVEDLDDVSLFRLADAIVVQKGAITDRDVFVYREGFYRGCTIAFALLCVAMATRAFCDGTAIQFPDYVFYVSRVQVLVAAAISAIASTVARQRFVRFSGYRVIRALHSLLATSKGS